MENIEPRTGGEHIVAQALETVLLEKVDREPGMGLSSNDYTAAEKEKLAGIPVLDYTSLEEQLVPGEFWLGSDGVKRQVYFRTFRGTTPAVFPTWTDDTHITMRYLHKIAVGFNTMTAPCLYVAGGIDGIPPGDISGDGAIYQLSSSGSGIDIVFNQPAPETLAEKDYHLTLKYTKA